MIQALKDMWNSNPSNTALFAVAFSGIITGIVYALRSQFARLFSWLSTQIFTSVTIASDNAYYYYFLSFLKKTGKLKHLRNVKIISTIDITKDHAYYTTDENNNVKLSFSNCSSIIHLYGVFYFISFTSHQLQNTNLEITNMHIKQFGRNFKNFDILFSEVMKISEKDKGLIEENNKFSPLEAPMDYLFKEKYSSIVNLKSVIRKNDELRNLCISQPVSKRFFDNVFLQEKTKKKIINRIETFINDYKFYKDHNLNYHLGLMLYGSPGCGKTSIIKAIASYFNFEIINVSSKNLDELPKLLDSYTAPNFVRFKDLFAKNLEKVYKDNLNISNKWKIENFDESVSSINKISNHRSWRSMNTRNLLWAAPDNLEDIPQEVFDKVYHDTIVDIISTNNDNFDATNKTISPIKFIVIEDIDTNTIIKTRFKNKNKNMFDHDADDDDDDYSKLMTKLKPDDEEDSNDKSWMEKYSESLLSEILNCLDGIATPEFFIIVATTNKIESIDPALLRPGRFDVCIEIPPVDKEVFNQFLNYYMPNEHKNSNIKDEDYELLPEVSVAKLQEHVLSKGTYEEIFEKYTTLNKNINETENNQNSD